MTCEPHNAVHALQDRHQGCEASPFSETACPKPFIQNGSLRTILLSAAYPARKLSAPDKPTSRLQKYRITNKGCDRLRRIKRK